MQEGKETERELKGVCRHPASWPLAWRHQQKLLSFPLCPQHYSAIWEHCTRVLSQYPGLDPDSASAKATWRHWAGHRASVSFDFPSECVHNTYYGIARVVMNGTEYL